MRTFEVVLLAVLAVAGLVAGVRRLREGRAARDVLPLLAIAVLVQVAVEGPRWQVLPAYAGAVLVAVPLAASAVGRRVPGPRTVASLALLGASAAGAVGWTLPIVTLEAPSGPLPVGTTAIEVVDAARTETYGATPGGPRRLVLQVWYPADPDAPVAPGPWMPEAGALAADGAAAVGLPPFALGHLELLRANATPDAAPAAGPHPVVVLSHGWSGFRTIQADLAEDLASHGYAVVAIDHSHAALTTVLSDGTVVPLDPEALPEFGTVPDDDYARASRALVATFAADVATVLAALDRGAVPLVDGTLALDRVALVGHSTGGGGAVAACAAEPRCAAVVGFDPWVEPVDAAVLGAGVAAPFLSLTSEEWATEPNAAVLASLHAASAARGVAEVRVTLAGALHRDFTLISALSPLARLLGLEGATAGDVTRAATRAWTRAFLDHHLVGTGPDPRSAPPVAPTATVEPPIVRVP